MVWWQIILIIIAIPIIFIVYIFLTGKSRRNKIFDALIKNNYISHKGEMISYDSFHYEAAEKFVEEHGGYIDDGYASVVLPLDNKNEIMIEATFIKNPMSDTTMLTVDDHEDIKKFLYG